MTGLVQQQQAAVSAWKGSRVLCSNAQKRRWSYCGLGGIGTSLGSYRSDGDWSLMRETMLCGEGRAAFIGKQSDLDSQSELDDGEKRREKKEKKESP